MLRFTTCPLCRLAPELVENEGKKRDQYHLIVKCPTPGCLFHEKYTKTSYSSKYYNGKVDVRRLLASNWNIRAETFYQRNLAAIAAVIEHPQRELWIAGLREAQAARKENLKRRRQDA